MQFDGNLLFPRESAQNEEVVWVESVEDCRVNPLHVAE